MRSVNLILLKSRVACAFLLLVFLSSLQAQTESSLASPLRSSIDEIAQQVLKTTGVPSASIAIVQDGRIVYTQAYGAARLDPQTAATPQMRYSIGSISKQFTAAAILMLVEEGKLSLDDPVSKYIPGLTSGNEITIRELLTHTSGYQDFWPQDYVPPLMLQPISAEGIMDRWARKPLDFEPGTKWQYSNTNYVIAGAIVEKVSGQPLLQTAQPAGLHAAGDEERGGHQCQQTAPDRPYGLFSLRAGAAASCSKRRPRLDVCRWRAGDDGRRSGEVGHLHHQPECA
jgi:CubicO group peptidase (beta-lactamase class C family)